MISMKAFCRRGLSQTGEYIRVQPLANGYRIDIIAEHSGVTKQLEPVHYPTGEIAEEFARRISQASGLPIVMAPRAGGQ